jgi:hypothetical protein
MVLILATVLGDCAVSGCHVATDSESRTLLFTPRVLTRVILPLFPDALCINCQCLMMVSGKKARTETDMLYSEIHRARKGARLFVFVLVWCPRCAYALWPVR